MKRIPLLLFMLLLALLPLSGCAQTGEESVLYDWPPHFYIDGQVWYSRTMEAKSLDELSSGEEAYEQITITYVDQQDDQGEDGTGNIGGTIYLALPDRDVAYAPSGGEDDPYFAYYPYPIEEESE